jgi:hypothetical protein
MFLLRCVGTSEGCRMPSQEINPAKLAFLFREEFKLCNVKPGETVAAWCGLFVGMILTFLKGPDGQKTIFWSVCIAQVLCLFWVSHSHLVLNITAAADDSVIVLVLTILILIGTFRVRSRL